MVMRRTMVVSLAVLLLSTPSQSSAQVLQSFEDLALRVNLDDRLRVEDQSKARITGRLIRLTPDAITIQTHTGEKRLTSETIHEVARRSRPLGKGALIGAAVFAVLGAVAVCSHEDESNNCVLTGALGAAPIGAGVGLAMGALVSSMKTIYRMPEGRTSVPPSPGGVQPGLLGDLALRVNLDDQLRVEDQSGARITGRLTHLTADEITIHTDAGEKQFTREAIRQVALRKRPVRLAVLVGAGVGAAAGAIAACTGDEREECPDAPILAGALGAGVGLAVGALMPRATIVYPEAQTRTSISPVLGHRAVGIVVSRQW
jgi:hypothetical protein